MKKFVKIMIILCIVCFWGMIGFTKSYANGDEPEGNETNATPQMNIYSISIGQGINGESTLVESDGEYLLMDIGDRASYEYVNNFLQEKNITHFSLYLSHFHGDHTGGFTSSENDLAPMYKLMRDYDIDYIYLPDVTLLQYKGEQIETNQDFYYRKVKEFYENSISTKNNPDDYKSFDEIYVPLKKGDTFSFGTVNASVIGPVGMDDYVSPLKEGEEVICPENADEDLLDDYQNNCSLVTKLVCGNVSFLTAGDLKTDGETALINEYANTDTLKATIYKASHHGLFPANGEEFMLYVRPDFTFVSNYAATEMGDNQKFWRIHTTQVNCNKYGFFYMGGNENKTLQINVNNDDISLYKDGENQKLNVPGWCTVIGGDGSNRTNEVFYFGDDGYTVKGVNCIEDKYYYLGTGGYKHFGSGAGDTYCGMITCSEDGKKRYFEESDGSMYMGANEVHEGAYDGLYYFDDEGALVTSTNGDWEIMQLGDDKYGVYSSGKLSQNVFRKIGDYTCYYDGTGKMLYGWQKINDKQYYLSWSTGDRYTGLKKISSRHYMFSDYGVMQTNCFRDTDNGKCYFGSNGVMYKGWKTINGVKYYFNEKNGAMYTGLKKIDGEYYVFSDSGKMYASTFKAFDDYTVYRYFGEDGKMAKGWTEINGNSYYFNKKSGARSVGLKKIGNYYYFFGSSGIQFKNGSKYINGVKYTFNKNGKMVNQPVAEKTYLTQLTSSSTNLYVKWAKKPVDGYQIYISTSLDGEYTKAATIKSGDTTYKKLTGLSRNTRYYVKIRSYKFIGDLAEYSDFSDVQNVVTLK